ncbi:N-acetylmuramoyl-L-alanine amidase [Fluviispira sanaruensis]|uniref:N-acetylmuramoyl-L-alanine amidase n=1 Tax=Fluviispira sanaruensis TaxID=2493639 RepID=A0A4P2VKC8_FLUSA|nr:N-acetylmuramoyl-L-alanine amidase [Fluviispira sanaruensis]BBH53048.1 hypothetical protein JCM31447_14910 [Fluviispira sanaruensis]
MLKKFVIYLLLLNLFISCKSLNNPLNVIIIDRAKPEEEKEKITLEESYKYDVDEDFLTDKKYPFRFKKDAVSSIVFHYTAQKFKKSLRSLTSGGNSSHWLVPEKGETIYKIVNEDRRARHAGESLWKYRKNVNVISVGVEIVNLGFRCRALRKYCPKNSLEWLEYPEEQQKLIVALAKDIQKRYNIDPMCVVGHSDIAPERKLDPGPLFPWKRLADNGVGAWVTEEEIRKEIGNIKNSIKGNISRLIVQIRFHEFGYDIKKMGSSNKSLQNKILKYQYSLRKSPIGELSELNQVNDFGNKKPDNNIFDDNKTNFAIQAFLMHYRPKLYLANENSDQFTDHYDKHKLDHIPDRESDNAVDNKAKYNVENIELLATLQALLVKYPNKTRVSCEFDLPK